MSYQCLLFDLDGTLVDSRADLINSVNLMLAEIGRERLPDARVLNFVGEGARTLIERALRATQNGSPQNSEIDGALEIFRRHYREHLLTTRAFTRKSSRRSPTLRAYRKPSSRTNLMISR